MSEDAKTMLFWASNGKETGTNREDAMYCQNNARKWAAYIIGQGC